MQLMEHNIPHTPSYNLTAFNKKYTQNLLANGFVTTNRKVKENLHTTGQS